MKVSSPLPWGEGGESSEPGEGFLYARLGRIHPDKNRRDV